MFDFGFSELLFTAVIALLVLGPERLPRAAKVAGLWIRRARASWYSMKSQVERELADDEMRRSLRETRQQFDQLRDDLQQPVLAQPAAAGSSARAAVGQAQDDERRAIAAEPSVAPPPAAETDSEQAAVPRADSSPPSAAS